MVAAVTARNIMRLLVGALIFSLVWIVSPPKSPPLYDGLGAPDEPYRYVTPPAGYRKTPAPTGAKYTHAVTLTNGMFGLASAETGPQVQVALEESSIVAPSGATTITVDVEPRAPEAQPADGTISGNVYRLTVETDHGPAQVHPGGNDVITLRAITSPPPNWVIDYLPPGGTWRQLATSRIGNDVYDAPLAGPGDYAVVAPAHNATSSTTSQSTSGQSKGSSVFVPLVVTALLLALFIWAVLLIRYVRLRGTGDAETEPDADPAAETDADPTEHPDTDD